MSDDQSDKSGSPCPRPESTDVELSEASIKSVGFPDTDRRPTDPFATIGDTSSDTSSDTSTQAGSSTQADSE
jgi:hypothetical protein